MIHLHLLYEFFKIGLFSFGGGFATIPFLYHISYQYGWYTIEELKQMIAVASITPGPVGVNMATFAGLKTAGLVGGILATIFEILPSFLCVVIIGKILKKYNENKYIKIIIKSLKPISCALLCAVALQLLKTIIHDTQALIILAILLLISWKSKKDPLFYIIISAILAIIIKTILPQIYLFK